MKDIAVDQVCLGSCTNSSYKDLVTVAKILKGKVAHPDVSFILAPGSRQVLENLARDGYLADLIASGARLMENACGFCIGNSQSPKSGAVSLRTSNRNFLGRSGTMDADVYLVSPETAAAAVITGHFTDPRDLEMDYPQVQMPQNLVIDDSMIHPAGQHSKQYRNLSRPEYRRTTGKFSASRYSFPGRSQLKSVIKSPPIISFRPARG